jgi:hypothetical protein
MIRDSRKDSNYFNKYLEYQNKRIQQFREKANSLRDEYQLGKLYLHISGFLHDELYASYSAGANIPELKSTYLEWLLAAEKSNCVCYSDLIDLASLCTLLEPGEDSITRISVLITNSEEKDTLVSLFNEWLVNGKSEACEGKIKYPEYADLKEVLTLTDKSKQAIALRNYIGEIWYSANSERSWNDSHLSKHDTYVG